MLSLVPVSDLSVCFSATFLIINPLHFCVCNMRSVAYCLCLLYHCRLHVMPWSLIGILTYLRDAEPHTTDVLLYLIQILYGTMVWDCQIFRAGSMLLCSHELLIHFFLPLSHLTLPFFEGFVLWGRALPLPPCLEMPILL